jgi:hypothetical protein
VYSCDLKITAWGLKIRETPEKGWEISPQLKWNKRGHPDIGLEVVDMQGLDNDVCLVVVQEMKDSTSEPVLYGLILDTGKLTDELLETCQQVDFFYAPVDDAGWTLEYIAEQWNWLQQAQQARAPKPLSITIPPSLPPSPAGTGRKRKSTSKTSTPGSSSQVVKEKRAKAVQTGPTLE